MAQRSFLTGRKAAQSPTRGSGKEDPTKTRVSSRNSSSRNCSLAPWSSLSGLPDSPENYSGVTYGLEEHGTTTTLTVTTDNIDTKESADHTEANWKSVLEALKKLIEK
jgi:hypothetical protein